MTKTVRMSDVNKAAQKIFGARLLKLTERVEQLERGVSSLKESTSIEAVIEEEEAQISEVKG